jgi:dynein heavy chain
VDKRSGRTYGPPPGKKLIYFIDDLNMPFVDKYGTQSPIELLIQHLNYGSFYDRKRLELKKDVKDVQCTRSLISAHLNLLFLGTEDSRDMLH